MDDHDTHEKPHIEKIPILHQIVDNLVSDASELIQDLYWGVKTYLIFGLISILFGIQTLIYNIDLLGERVYIPLFITGCMIFSGLAQIINYFGLRKKYSRLFQAQETLKNP
jgi:hypothetical protein